LSLAQQAGKRKNKDFKQFFQFFTEKTQGLPVTISILYSEQIQFSLVRKPFYIFQVNIGTQLKILNKLAILQMKYIFPLLILGLLFANCKSEPLVPAIDPVEQFAIDTIAINDYLTANNLNAAVTSSGLRYIIDDPGRGVPIQSTSTINLLITGFYLNGRTFLQTDDCSPTSIFLPNVVSGFSEGLQLFNTWGKGKIYLPSVLAFGPNGTDNIPPNSVLGFDFEIVEQKEFDRTKIKEYIAENNLIKVDSTLSGIYYTISNPGMGENPTSTSNVTVTYKGYLSDGTVFDQSDSPISFGLNGLIQGWQEAIPLLKREGSGTFLIPSDLAYGPGGSSPTIGSNTMIIFDITLIDFN